MDPACTSTFGVVTFHPGLEKVLLAQIAYESFEQDQLFFLKDDITRRIGEFLADTLDAPKYLDGAAVLRAIERQQGILVERATDIYSFSHLTLQEYLTAFHIKEEGLEAELIAHHLTDKRWREVFLLVAGLMGNKAINFLMAIEAASRTYLTQYPKIISLIQWAEASIAGATSPFQLFGQRAGAIAIARAIASASPSASPSAIASVIDMDIASASAIDSVIASARARASVIDMDMASVIDMDMASIVIDTASVIDILIDIDIASAIDSVIASAIDSAIDSFAQIFSSSRFTDLPKQLEHMVQTVPDAFASSKALQAWADELEALWLDALGLTREDLTFDRAEAKALQNYLYATELLLRCKDAAVRIPKQAWAELEERLLTYPS
jgi:hypothetical protein